DTGRWELQGPAFVTSDGLFIETAPGVGIRQPGWHGVAPGTVTRGGAAVAADESDPCQQEFDLAFVSANDCFQDGLAFYVPNPLSNCLGGLFNTFVRGGRDCSLNPDGCDESVAMGSIGLGISCAPGSSVYFAIATGAAGLWHTCANGTAAAYGNLLNCRRANNQDPAGAMPVPRLMDENEVNPMLDQATINFAIRDLTGAVLGDPVWVNSD